MARIRSAGALALAVAFAVSAGACKKKAQQSSSSSSSPGSAVTSAAHNPATLWKLAPKSTAVAILAADGAGKKLASAVTEIVRVVRAQPLGQMLLAKLRAGLPPHLGLDPFDPTTWTKAGIDLDKGTAMFVTPGQNVLIILPVTDRATFRKVTGSKQQTIDGVDYDRIGDSYCREIDGRYACADDTATLATVGTGAGGALPTFAAKLPKKLQGDVEVVADLSKFPPAMADMKALAPALTNITHLVLAGHIGGGRLSVNGWLQGMRSGPVGLAFAKVPDLGSTATLIAGADGVLAVRVPRALLGKAIQNAPKTPGVDLKANFLDKMTGAMVAVAKGSGFMSGQLAWELSDAKPLKSKLGPLCNLLSHGTSQLTATMKDGRCVGKAKLNQALPPQAAALSKLVKKTTMALAVQGSSVVISVDNPPAPTGRPSDLGGGPVARDLLTGDWQAVLWARSLDPLAGLPAADAKRLDAAMKSFAPKQFSAGITLARWLLAHVYDAGIGLSLRPDGLRGVIAMDTFAADPAATYKEYEAAVKHSVSGDFAGYRKVLAAIATEHPSSLAGRQAKAVARGVPAFGPGAGVMATIAIPAYMGYIARSRALEQQLQTATKAEKAAAKAKKKAKAKAKAKAKKSK